MISIAVRTTNIDLPDFSGKVSMIPFSLGDLTGIPAEFKDTALKMLSCLKDRTGTAYFTIHGKRLKKGETLRRGGPHTDGNYEPHNMTFGSGGWKVGQDGPGINTTLHARQYNNPLGGIILASNFYACNGWLGEYKETPKTGGDCEHITLGESFELQANSVYYGNNHFIHESLRVSGDCHRVFARITLPETHVYEA